MRAKDIMTTSVFTVTPFTSVHDVAMLLWARRIGGVPVLLGRELLGMVRESDLLHRREIGTDDGTRPISWWTRLLGRDRLPRSYIRSHGLHARDVMSAAVCASEDTTLRAIAELFETHRIGSVPVLRGHDLVGIVARADLVRAVAANSPVRKPSITPSDEAIREQLVNELEKQPWWQRQWTSVNVQGGVVSFAGLVDSEAAQEAARVAAENVPGVRGVCDDRTSATQWEAMP